MSFESDGIKMSKHKIIICDLDGTLCNTDNRKHFMEQKPKDWKSFYAGIPNDPINRWCYELIGRMNAVQPYINIILV